MAMFWQGILLDATLELTEDFERNFLQLPAAVEEKFQESVAEIETAIIQGEIAAPNESMWDEENRLLFELFERKMAYIDAIDKYQSFKGKKLSSIPPPSPAIPTPTPPSSIPLTIPARYAIASKPSSVEFYFKPKKGSLCPQKPAITKRKGIASPVSPLPAPVVTTPPKKSHPRFQHLQEYIDSMAQLPSSRIPKYKKCRRCESVEHKTSKCFKRKYTMEDLFGPDSD